MRSWVKWPPYSEMQTKRMSSKKVAIFLTLFQEILSVQHFWGFGWLFDGSFVAFCTRWLNCHFVWNTHIFFSFGTLFLFVLPLQWFKSIGHRSRDYYCFTNFFEIILWFSMFLNELTEIHWTLSKMSLSSSSSSANHQRNAFVLSSTGLKFKIHLSTLVWCFEI